MAKQLTEAQLEIIVAATKMLSETTDASFDAQFAALELHHMAFKALHFHAELHDGFWVIARDVEFFKNKEFAAYCRKHDLDNIVDAILHKVKKELKKTLKANKLI